MKIGLVFDWLCVTQIWLCATYHDLKTNNWDKQAKSGEGGWRERPRRQSQGESNHQEKAGGGEREQAGSHGKNLCWALWARRSFTSFLSSSSSSLRTSWFSIHSVSQLLAPTKARWDKTSTNSPGGKGPSTACTRLSSLA
eukprot:11185510-Lingulodinium_polyedra.AAC.1